MHQQSVHYTPTKQTIILVKILIRIFLTNKFLIKIYYLLCTKKNKFQNRDQKKFKNLNLNIYIYIYINVKQC